MFDENCRLFIQFYGDKDLLKQIFTLPQQIADEWWVEWAQLKTGPTCFRSKEKDNYTFGIT